MDNYYKIRETNINVCAEFIDESNEEVEIKISDNNINDHIFIEVHDNFIVVGTFVSNRKSPIKIYSAYKLKSLYIR